MEPLSSPRAPDSARINHAAFTYYGRLQKVKQYVDQHFTENITVKMAADVACLEKKYFSNYFHTKTGVRFTDYVSRMRIDHAKKLMESQDTPISEIALVVGYRNLRTFERAFKKNTGITPMQFRDIVKPS